MSNGTLRDAMLLRIGGRGKKREGRKEDGIFEAGFTTKLVVARGSGADPARPREKRKNLQNPTT